MGRNRQFIMAAALLAAITAGAYWQALSGAFISDDRQYILSNPHVQHGLNWADMRWALTSVYASNWHPLTWISLMLDNQIWGLDAFGCHLTNLLLHIAAALLLFYILRRMTGSLWRSAFVAALFAVHPLHVQSVAWVAERKDVLSTVFMMLTMLAYIRYVEHPGIKRYLPMALFFALGLMSKPMLVSLPVLLLLLDYWPLHRMTRRGGLQRPPEAGGRRSTAPTDPEDGRPLKASPMVLVLEKLPLFLLSAASCVVTYLAQSAGGAVAMKEWPIGVRAANAAVSTIAYLWKTIVPIRLAAFYPHPGTTLPAWQVIGSIMLLIGISAVVVVRARKQRHLVVGWLWYLITLLPVIGLVQVGMQAMADRYTYVPLIGIFAAVTWGVSDAFSGVMAKDAASRQKRARKHKAPSLAPGMLGLLSVPAVLIAACAVGAGYQAGYWKDEISLCTHAIAVTRGNAVMHNNLGVVLYERGELEASIAEYRKALEISPDYADVHINLGNAYVDAGNPEEAIAEFNLAIEANPKDPRAYNNLATTFGKLNMIDKTIEACRKAIELDPSLVEPHRNLGQALAMTGDRQGAVKEYRTALALSPNDAVTRVRLGETLVVMQKPDEAIDEFSRAIEIQPDLAQAHLDLGMALYAKHDYAGAWREVDLCRSYGIQPDSEFLQELGMAMPEPE